MVVDSLSRSAETVSRFERATTIGALLVDAFAAVAIGGVVVAAAATVAGVSRLGVAAVAV